MVLCGVEVRLDLEGCLVLTIRRQLQHHHLGKPAATPSTEHLVALGYADSSLFKGAISAVRAKGLQAG